MTEQILMGVAGLTAEAFAAIGAGVVVVVSTFIFRRRQRAVVARLEDRVTHLAAGVSLLANTTEDGLRSIAAEIARLAGTAEQKAQPPATTRQRIAAAAGHGRTVQDIAATEQVSEGEVLLHLLLDKLTPEGASADAC